MLAQGLRKDAGERVHSEFAKVSGRTDARSHPHASAASGRTPVRAWGVGCDPPSRTGLREGFEGQSEVFVSGCETPS